MLRNDGGADHDFAIEGFDAQVIKPGKYEAVCTVPGHKAAGMRFAVSVVD